MNSVVKAISVSKQNHRPRKFKLVIKGIREEDKEMQNWYWVNLQDLTSDLCAIVIRDPQGAPQRSLGSVSGSEELFDRYGLLCGRKYGLECLSWVRGTAAEYALNSFIRPDPDNAYQICLPWRFSEAVLNVAEAGIYKVCTKVPGPSDKGFQPSNRLVGYEHSEGGKEHPIVKGSRPGTFIVL